MKILHCIIAILGLVSLSACDSKPAGVGSYIYADADGALMVQITSIDDGRVQGTWSVVTASAPGKTDALSRPVSGTMEGDTLNLTVENGTGLSLVTGALDGENLRLTIFAGGSSSKVTLTKTDPIKFEELANGQRVRAAEKLQETETIMASKQQADLRSKTQGSIDRLADSVLQKSQEVDEKSKKLELVIAGYRVDYSRIGKIQNAKQKFNAESDDGSFRITQLEYQIEGISNNLENVHGQVQSYMQSLDEFVAETDSTSSGYLAECGADKLLNCSRLASANQTLEAKYDKLRQGYEREKAAYKGIE